MPFYNTLRNTKAEDRRTAEGLLRLKAALDRAIPIRSLDKNLLIASWNIREFGGTKHGGRGSEPLFYIAEIMSRFDLIAVQEVRDNLSEFETLMRLLGRWWKFIVSDVTPGRQGNNERLAFIYDSRKLSFGGLAGEVSEPMSKDGDLLKSEFAYARSPYIVGFQAGWFRFSICTDHLYYGQSRADDPQRAEELARLVEFLKKRAKPRKSGKKGVLPTFEDRWAKNIVLLGDFNVFSVKDKMFKDMTKVFTTPAKLRGEKSNALRTKPYDQIALLSPQVNWQLESANAGVFDFYKYVYRSEDRKAIAGPKVEEKAYRQWRTYKMSDHLPMWTEIMIDFGSQYLEGKARPPR